MNLLLAEVVAQGENNFLNQIYPMIVLVLLFAVMYFFTIRPQSKQKKAEEEMRKSLRIGDEILTIGGVEGRIVSIREDTDSVIVETGADRTRLKLKRWAIASLNNPEPVVNAGKR